MRTLSLVFLGTLIAVIAAATSRRAPTAPVASEAPVASAQPVRAAVESPAPAPTARREIPSQPAGGTSAPFARPTVPQAALEPMTELEREVGIEDWQREALVALISERQGALRQAFSDALREGRGEAGACAAVEKIFGEYEPRVMAQFNAIQQARYVEGRRAGTIGRPMLVYTYDEEF